MVTLNKYSLNSEIARSFPSGDCHLLDNLESTVRFRMVPVRRVSHADLATDHAADTLHLEPCVVAGGQDFVEDFAFAFALNDNAAMQQSAFVAEGNMDDADAALGQELIAA